MAVPMCRMLWRSLHVCFLITIMSSAKDAINKGLRAHTFQGISGVLEVECLAEALESHFDVLTMTLFANDKMMAFVSPKTSECTTAEQFSACVMQSPNSRTARLKTLVLDVAEGQFRKFVCNITSLNALKKVETVSWSLDVYFQIRCAGGGF